MRFTIRLALLSAVIILGYFAVRDLKNNIPDPLSIDVGTKVDSLNGVYVYYNGAVSHVDGRNLAPDGYNLGLKYQCVEFAKRYYYQHLNHKMPDSYGHAKDFFQKSLKDSTFNTHRGLMQFTNGSTTKPRVDDLLVFDGHPGNKYGHIAIVSAVKLNKIEIIQQNPGPFERSRAEFPLKQENGLWTVEGDGVLGWLGK
ncbi:MAG: CHAP domain-containing protein [Saprospiraceae bacterium]|nr:CHAP domain-containing protein [Saprospiraceae bacterium]